MRSLRVLLAAAVVLGLTGACDGSSEQPSGHVRIATGSPTAVYYAYGTAIAALIRTHLPGVQPEVLATAASAENVHKVLDGNAEVGFTQADIARTAVEQNWAETPTDEPSPLVALAKLYDDYVQLVVREDSGIKTVADLRGKRLSVGAAGSGTEVTAGYVLDLVPADLKASLRLGRQGLDDSVAALRGGTLDAFFFSGGLPVGAIANLATTVPIRLLDLSAYVDPLRRAHGESYAERVVPATTYAGVSTPTPTIGIPNYLVVLASMPESMAYALTKLLFTGKDELAKAHPAGARLNPRSAVSTPPLALHPGAARYYREAKQ